MRNSDGGDGSAESGKAILANRTILVVCPTHRDYRELPLISPQDIQYIFHDYASTSLEDLINDPTCYDGVAADPLDEIEMILAKVSGIDIAGVISSDDYPGSALAAVVAKRLGLHAPDPTVTLICQHKYLSRAAQAKLVPHAVPPFALIDVSEGTPLPDNLRFPLFVKPVKSFFSIGAEKIDSASQLAGLLPHWASLDQFFLPLDRMLKRYTGSSIGTQRLIAEGLLKGEQVTVEGYVHGGVACIMGVVDSIMFPGTRSFSRFDYPSSLPDSVQERMAAIAVTLMQGIGFDNGLFNIEMMYDAEIDLISIIEINPRMASQFADLYEKVDGTSSYTVLLDIAQGRSPGFTRLQGRYRFAASCVLRSFEDRLVAAVPTEADIERLARFYPDIRVELHATVGRRLSHELQDRKSYRYGIVNLGGRDRADVLGQFRSCRERLGIELLPVGDADGARPTMEPERQGRQRTSVLRRALPSIAVDGLLDPIREGRHVGIDAGEQGIAALRTPAHDPDLDVAAGIAGGGDDERTAAEESSAPVGARKGSTEAQTDLVVSLYNLGKVATGGRKDAVIDEGLQILARLDADGKLSDDQNG